MNQQSFKTIQQFLYDNANSIQRLATKQHKVFIGGRKFRSEIIAKYQLHHIEIVEQLANSLSEDIQQDIPIFKKAAKLLAMDAVKDDLTLQEAIDGIIFLKQSIWEKINQAGLLKKINNRRVLYYQPIYRNPYRCRIISNRL